MKIKFAVLALLAAAGTAMANIDFSGVTTTVPITLPSSLHLGGVIFQYDPQGNVTTAYADSKGIFGSTGGALNLSFDSPAVGLRFDFSVLNVIVPLGCGLSCAVVDSMPMLFDNGDFPSPIGTLTPYGGTSSLGDITGHLDYSTTIPFTLATLYPSTAGSQFTISNIGFDTLMSATPEPASFLLPMGMGMLGLGFARRFSRRRS